MPKAPSLKVLKRENFVYAPNCAKQPLASVPNSALNLPENGGSGARATFESMRDRSTSEDSGDVEALDVAHDFRAIFPHDEAERQKYRTKNGKKVTKYQWDVYDFILKIPRGKVTTYKIISESIGGSARSAGGALKINPFAPYVPCHRVVASNLFIGGFFGQWAGRKVVLPKSEQKDQDQIKHKIRLLKKEGIEVDEKGFLLGREGAIWRPA